MYNTSLRILNDTAEAEDIMQESFLDVFRKLNDYSGEGSFGGWLRKIVVNNCLDALRRRKSTWPFDEAVMDVPDETWDDSGDQNYRVEEIKKTINTLPDEHRIMLSLFLLEGYDHEEISLILSISNNASRTRFHRAKQILLRQLEQQRKLKQYNPN